MIGRKWFTQRRTVSYEIAILGEQILDVTKANRKPEIEPDRLVNDLRGNRYPE